MEISCQLVSWLLLLPLFHPFSGETMETVTDFIFLGFKITADGDCSHEIKRHFFLGRKAVTNVQFSSVHSVISNSLWPHEPQHASLSITNSRSPPKSVSIELVMPSNHFILCCPLLLLPSIYPQHQGLFKWVSSSPGDGERQECLACCSPQGHKESDMTKWLNSNILSLNGKLYKLIFITSHLQ